MDDSRTLNTKRNIISGTIKQILNIALPFVIRTIVLYTLGAEYQGLSGLFTSILSVLNLTELGFSTAVMVALYSPLAKKDYQTVCAITTYLKKVYNYIGITILALGLLLLPFLPRLITGSVPNDVNIYILFIIYLLNAAISYMLFAYKSVVINAMQREDIVSNISTVSSTAIRLAQIIVLLMFKNYYVYILVLPIGTIVNNFLLQYYSKKYFPNIKPIGAIEKETRLEIVNQIKAIFIGKIGDVARNSCDDIVISAFLGLSMVAVYDNYYYIYAALYALLLVFMRAMQASVGNSIVVENKEKNYKDLKIFTFIFMWITGWCTACMCALYQPFMTMWMKNNNDMLLSTGNMVLFCIYFYAINMNDTRNLYITGAGLYPQCKNWFIIETLSNLTLNIVLGKLFGITGIIVATIITIFLFNFIARTNVLFKSYFMISSKAFYLSHMKYLVVTVGVCFINYIACNAINAQGVLGFILKLILSFALPNIIYILTYFKSESFKDMLLFAKKVLK